MIFKWDLQRENFNKYAIDKFKEKIDKKGIKPQRIKLNYQMNNIYMIF